MTAKVPSKRKSLAQLIGDTSELGVTLRIESDAAARRVAGELCPSGTREERLALYEFLNLVANAIRWPTLLAGQTTTPQI
jgi:hypothetical protein